METKLVENNKNKYQDFKSVFKKSNTNYIGNILKKDDLEKSIFDKKKEYFKSIINGKGKVINYDNEYIYDGGLILASTNINGAITYANSKFCEVSGYSKNQIIGLSQTKMRHPDMPRNIVKEIWCAISKQNTWEGIIKTIREDGRFCWAYFVITPIINNDKFIGYSSIGRPMLASELNKLGDSYNN
jgi:PAS domain S-box-containing protein